MDHQAHDDGHHVHAQLPGNHLQVSDGRNLPRNQGGNADRRVPHDYGDHRHDYLVEDVEEIGHDPPSLAHPAHADPKGDEEADQAEDVHAPFVLQFLPVLNDGLSLVFYHNRHLLQHRLNLLEAGLHEVLRKQVSEQVEEGVQTADLRVPRD